MFDFISVLAAQTTSDDGSAVVGFIFLFLWCAMWGAIGASMAKKRFRQWWMGGLLGFFLGWIGLIIVAIVGYKKGPPCIACNAPLQQSWVNGQVVSARMCAMCGSEQRPMATGPPPIAPAVPPMPV